MTAAHMSVATTQVVGENIEASDAVKKILETAEDHAAQTNATKVAK